MQYQKIFSGKVLIEIHNSWQGVETVYANGQTVSQKASFWGTSHPFKVVEDGRPIYFILTTRVAASGTGVVFDLSRNGEMVATDVSIPYGSMPEKPHLKLKKSGLKKLEEYDLEDALDDFQRAADLYPDDPELYFHMACAHSVLENALEGFHELQRAVELGLQESKILTHDMLAFLRLHPAFDAFKGSGFKAVGKTYLKVPSVLEAS